MLKSAIGFLLFVCVFVSVSAVALWAEDCPGRLPENRIIIAKVKSPGKRISALRIAPVKAANSRIIGEVLEHQSAGVDAITGVLWSGQAITAAANIALKKSSRTSK